MSSDMFSSLVEKGFLEAQPVSYRETEFLKWNEFSEKCKARRYTKCNKTDMSCFIDNCESWQLINYIKYGILE